MSTQTLIRLVIAAVLLVLVWIGIGVLSEGGTEPPAASESWTPVLAVLQGGGDDAESMRMEDAEGPRVLERGEDGSWMVNGFLADSAVVERFWTTAADVELSGLVASNPSNHERMGVAGDSAIAVTIGSPAGAVDFVVGSRGPGVGTAYVRLPSEDEVYTMAGGLRAFVARSEWEWRDKRMTAMDTAAIARIDVDTPEYDYALMRQDTVWTLGADTVQTPTVTGILEELGNMVAAGALDPDDPLALAPVTITITALGSEGDTIGVATLGDGSGDRAGRTPGKETIYRIPNFRTQRLTPPPDLLIPQ